MKVAFLPVALECPISSTDRPEIRNKWMDKWCKKESSSRQTTAIKCPLNDARIRKTIKQQIDSGGQEGRAPK